MLQMQVNWPLGPKSPPGHVLPANKQVIGTGTALSPEGEEVGSCSPRWPSCWMTGGQGFWQLPSMRCLSPSKAPQVVLHMARSKLNFLTETRTTYLVLICHAGPYSSKSCIVFDVNRNLSPLFLPGPFTGRFELRLISCLSIVPQCLTSVLWKGPFELPWGHTPVRSPQGAPYF